MRESKYSRLGLDSHADMTCVGSDAYIIDHVVGQSCTVHPFHESYSPKQNVQVCNAAFAFDHNNGETFILRLNQCLDFSSSMEHSLLCTNQVRSHGIIVEDAPKAVDITHKSRQAIIIPNNDDEAKESIELPLSMHGPVPYLSVRRPSESEY